MKDKQSDADILVFQEVIPQLASELLNLQTLYPYYASNPEDGAFGSLIMSKVKFNTAKRLALDHSKVKYTKLHFEDDLELYEIHALAPVSATLAKDRNTSLNDLSLIIAQDKTLHKILLGDMNITPYSYAFTQLEKTSGLNNSMRGFTQSSGTWPNFFLSIFRIPIDQLLSSNNIITLNKTIGPDLGSDHLPVITELLICK